MKRPEWIKCIRHTHADQKDSTWCGRKVEAAEFCFVDADHAAYAVRNKDRLIPCLKCAEAISKLLLCPNERA